MSLELWNTLATFGTFIVIAATAIAALVQLRHARGSNQIAALKDLQDETATPRFAEAEQVVINDLPAKLKDPEFRYYLATRCATTNENQAVRIAARDIGNHYERLGLLVKTGLADRDLTLSLWASNAKQSWDLLAPYLAIGRLRLGDVLWENFEFFVVLSREWLAAHPKGDYPANLSRITLSNEWLEADKQYAASRVPA
jgi:hypothetical protein